MSVAIDLDAVEARAKAATPDAVTYSYEGLTRGENPRHQFSICNGTWQDEPTRPHRCIAMVYSDSEDDAPDAEFYANARADVLALLADARAHRTRADAAEAECARLRAYIDDATREAARVVERMEAAARTFVRVLGERDEARLDRDALRAIVEGRAEAPDDAEIAAHAAAGGAWRVRWSGGSGGMVRSRDIASELARETRDATSLSRVGRWWPLDATGRPTTWPTGGGL